MIDATKYTDLITSEHSQRPRFMALCALLVQHSVDMQNVYSAFPDLFDVTKAVGDQQNIIGKWIGVDRSINTPLTDVFFSWGVDGLGWGQGLWLSTTDQIGSLTVLPDESYRTLQLATIASNQWDGTIPGAYDVTQVLFEIMGFQILILDNQDMTMSVIFLASNIDAVTAALLTSGLLTVRPAGVQVAGYFSAVEPVFGWGLENSVVAGWGEGNWLQLSTLGQTTTDPGGIVRST